MGDFAKTHAAVLDSLQEIELQLKEDRDNNRARFDKIESLNRHANVMWNGQERRRDAIFSDEQYRAIKEICDERQELQVGRWTTRLVLSSLGSGALAAIGTIAVLLGLKK